MPESVGDFASEIDAVIWSSMAVEAVDGFMSAIGSVVLVYVVSLSDTIVLSFTVGELVADFTPGAFSVLPASTIAILVEDAMSEIDTVLLGSIVNEFAVAFAP